MTRPKDSRVLFELVFDTVNDPDDFVVVKIFAPEPSEQYSGEWQCRYSLSRFAGPDEPRAIGSDPFGAFLNAYRHIASILTAHEAELRYGTLPVRVVLPKLVPYYSDEFSKHMDEVYQRELDQYVASMKRKLGM